ncbi:hypothetical protein [Halostagnicola sp. A-GB9-2]|uniref:hypothetical protein n=1 Tax=Halostagnicola sp. A-GB9-2 TaxID=3048066 RepID=UPI0024BF3689|nr:hypothetical protein [Halostagnicola sp. A-GB9-2]MDJ1430654.1 hypothetical protein [Halostagnicola sp. A-GB9-2]
MYRRRVLLAGVSGTVIAVSGCLSGESESDPKSDSSDGFETVNGSESDGSDGGLEGEPTDESEFENTDATPEPPADPADPVATSRTGSLLGEGRSHQIRIWNLADDYRTVAYDLGNADDTGGQTSVVGSYGLAPEQHVLVELFDRESYELEISADGTSLGIDGDEPIELEEARFDDACPRTDVFVGAETDLVISEDAEADHCSG